MALKVILSLLLLGILLSSGCIQTTKPVDNQTNQDESDSVYKNFKQSRELTPDEISSGNFHQLTLSIRGMTCPFCPQNIENSLIQLDGVIKVEVSLEQKGGMVIYDSTKLSKEDIITSEIFSGVYKAKILEDKVITNE